MGGVALSELRQQKEGMSVPWSRVKRFPSLSPSSRHSSSMAPWGLHASTLWYQHNRPEVADVNYGHFLCIQK